MISIGVPSKYGRHVHRGCSGRRMAVNPALRGTSEEPHLYVSEPTAAASGRRLAAELNMIPKPTLLLLLH